MAQREDGNANPPIDFAVAVRVGTPDEELARGLREGWIRRPPGAGEKPGEVMSHGQDGTAPAVGGSMATLRHWLSRLDASLDEAAIDAIWQEAGADDAERSRSLARFVFDSLGIATNGRSDARSVEAALAGCNGEARIVRLTGRGGAELESLAREDAGARRAIATHSRWALTGERGIDALADPQGRYDRFDRDTGERLLSEAWLDDRARHASWRLRDDERSVAGDGWRFVDRAAPEATVEIASTSGGPVHQVIFARDGGDNVTGGVTTDRLHGGDGDDSLRGRGGDDLLEGGDGSDVLLGGSGRDDLAGGRGDDELDGGSGSDRLDGGSGADVLSGGRGADLLRGGAGEDVYAFASGDGADVVEDDGGTISIDDVDVHGTMRRDGDAWRSPDGEFTFELAQGEGGTTLRLRVDGEDDAIDLAGWSQGRYGITLDGLDEEPKLPDDAGDAAELPLAGDPGASDPGDGGEQPDVAAFLDGTSSQAGGVAVVDWRSLHAALAAWEIPAPPAAGEATTSPAALTPADVADALAESGGADDDADAVVLPNAWTSTSPPWWREGAVPAPYDQPLRSTT
jgi:hypothetical protein